jgi:hypothetical protein
METRTERDRRRRAGPGGRPPVPPAVTGTAASRGRGSGRASARGRPPVPPAPSGSGGGATQPVRTRAGQSGRPVPRGTGRPAGLRQAPVPGRPGAPAGAGARGRRGSAAADPARGEPGPRRVSALDEAARSRANAARSATTRPPATDRRDRARKPSGQAAAQRRASPWRFRPAAPDRARTRPATSGRRPASGRPTADRLTSAAPRTAALRATGLGRARRAGVPRAPFILLVLSLLGGGLICLLVINTTLGTASFQIDRLQQSANTKQQQVQELEQQIAADQSPAKIAQEACLLGMRPQNEVQYLDLRTHKIVRQPPGSVVQSPQVGCRQ